MSCELIWTIVHILTCNAGSNVKDQLSPATIFAYGDAPGFPPSAKNTTCKENFGLVKNASVSNKFAQLMVPLPQLNNKTPDCTQTKEDTRKCIFSSRRPSH